MRAQKTIGVIGGSGLYEMEGLTDIEEVALDTPFGPPSDAYLTGRLGDVRMIFLPRHGRGHRVLPNEINYVANMYGLKQLGADYVISVSAVGSLREEIRPGDIVLVDQFIDRTRARRSTFFGEGVVAHVSFADPVSGPLRKLLLGAARDLGAAVHDGGTYVVMNGPQFSTRAESHMYRSWGAHVIGMTNLPEAKLAREAELPYATLALATDYDCWREGEEEVSVEAVVATLQKNVATARAIVREAALRIAKDPPSDPASENALRHAIMTAPDRIPEEALRRLGPILRRYFPDKARG